MKRTSPQQRTFRLDFTPLRRRRRALELTQRELAVRCGVQTNTIWRLEQNRNRPSAEFLVAAARALGTPEWQLYTVVEATG